MDAIKTYAGRALRWLAQAFASDAGGRAVLWGSALLFAGSATIDTDARPALAGAAGALFATSFFVVLRRLREHRHRPYAVVGRQVYLMVEDGGRRLTFRAHARIRAKRLINRCDFRLSWSGSTEIANNYRAWGDGFDVVVHEVTRSVTVFRFTFDPVRRWHTKTVGLEVTLDEPQRAYLRDISFDASAYQWSPFSHLRMEIAWDEKRPVRKDSVRCYAYRNLWEYRAQDSPPQSLRKPRDLKEIPSGLQWNVRPVRGDRQYIMVYELSNDA